jgi:hypothetical protein
MGKVVKGFRLGYHKARNGLGQTVCVFVFQRAPQIQQLPRDYSDIEGH